MSYSVLPAATIFPYAGTTSPDGWLLCNGAAVSRTTYSALFNVIGTSYGQGDNSTTFNLPDYRWSFLRGYGPNISVTGSGSAASNQATFTAHGFNRTGVKARLSSGTLTGLAASTDYWVIFVDANTLAFATSKANALAGTRIAISGANSAVIVQHEDPDAAVRTASTVGANTAGNVGSVQDDAMQGHWHLVGHANGTASGARPTNTATGGTVTIAGSATGGGWAVERALGAVDDGTNGTPRTSSETRVKNAYVNYIIKV
jgi:microcystin-dependent protein